MSDDARKVIEVNGLDISFKMASGDVHAIRGVDFYLRHILFLQERTRSLLSGSFV